MSARPFEVDDLETLPIVHLVSAGAPIHAGQVHRVWRAMVQTPGSTEPAIPVVLKAVTTREKLVIELACSLASGVLKLPVPRGMLALAEPDDLPHVPSDALTLPGLPYVLCFASVLRWPDDTAERALDDDSSISEFLWHRFCATTTGAPSAAWDELVANADRHTGNFVFDGTRYWLIDHELSLRPIAEAMRLMTRADTRQQVLTHKAERNQVAYQMLQRRPNDHGMLLQPRHFEARAKALELFAVKMSQWRSGIPALDDLLSDTETVLRGIILRLPALSLQLNERISNPGGPLLWTASNDSPNKP